MDKLYIVKLARDGYRLWALVKADSELEAEKLFRDKYNLYYMHQGTIHSFEVGTSDNDGVLGAWEQVL